MYEFEFKAKFRNVYTHSSVPVEEAPVERELVMKTTKTTLPEILEEFADFLRGAGFVVNGDLVVEEPFEELNKGEGDD